MNKPTAGMESTATLHVSLDTAKCRAYGVCVGLAPDVFDLPKGSPVAVLQREIVRAEDHDDIEEAVYACPAQALKLTRSEGGS